jgi:hypothetical protein
MAMTLTGIASMKAIARFISIFAVLVLVGCGGGGGSAGTCSIGCPTTPPPGSTTPTAASVELLGSSGTASTGGDEVTITALVKNSSNVALASEPVIFSTDTGTLLSAATTTSATGTATARFTTGSSRSNRTATITVTSGAVTGTLTIAVTGSVIRVASPQSLGVGERGEVVVTALDGSGRPIAGAPVAVSSSLSNGLSNAAPVTDANGVARTTYTATTGGADAVTVTAAGVTNTVTIQAARQDVLAFVAPDVAARTVPLNTSAAVTVEYRVNGVASSGNFAVRFAATSGTITPLAATTGIALSTAGRASGAVQSSFAGPSTIQATLVNLATGAVVTQSSIALQFVATTPSNIVLQVSPKSVGPSVAGSTNSQAIVRATVTDAAGNPVQGISVNFSKIADPSGGNLTDASAVTDAYGQAVVRYNAGATSTSADGVRLQATVAGNAAISDDETLTVNQTALFIGLGTGNQITNFNETTYQKVWTVYVTDSSGAAIPNQQVTVSILPTRYRKGSYVLSGDFYVIGAWQGGLNSELNMNNGSYWTCANEDINYDGVLTSVKDVNGNLRLDPGNVITVNGGGNTTTVTTDANGFALLSLRYAESYAEWVEVRLKASATVNGTESSNQAIFWPPGAAPDYKKDTGPPAGLYSPFGQRPSCTDSR